ncbi:MAG: M23 family metallopeptidase [Gammaproteobacteria bacterium]|nr:M23 family metallopeptidase [Gammaproteobacteria bacterium]MDH3535288.1 M23 family metallopeptidase [Gammaproteobacteria bacterium]
MNILFLSSNRGQIFGLNLRKPLHLLFMMGLLGMLMAASVYLGYTLNPNQDNQALIDEWQADVHRQQLQLNHIREEADANIDALSSRIGLLQAHVMRLDALGQKLVHMASIDTAEFDFDNTPAIGGPEAVSNKGLDPSELSQAIEQLSYELETRENQLVVLENYVLDENLQKEVQPSGRPITKGWISSYYGMRTHPLSGRREMHKGIDFAGKLGGPVIAVAKGVVTYAGKRYGYGNVIDIAHGNGYTTRYAHNSRLLVSVGDTVEKGFHIAEIGSSGRSTGPHVHFEVLKNGREINPVKFIRAAN